MGEPTSSGKAIAAIANKISCKTPAPSMQWIAPEEGTVKLNTDASFLSDSGQSWGGAVARNHKGLVLFSIGKKFATSASAREAEAQAVLVGLEALASEHKGPVVVETDCKSVANELTHGAVSRSPSYGLILDIKSALSVFDRHKVSHAGAQHSGP